MPHANIWIRRDNYEKWENIPDKSNWLNTLLENSQDTSEYGAVKDTPVGKMTTVLSETVPPITTGDKLPKSLCEHGQVKGQCFQKGCKFGRYT